MHEYTATTTNATNVINATLANENAVVTIKVDDTEIENGSPATWTAGENVITIAVSCGEVTEIYTVTIMKS